MIKESKKSFKPEGALPYMMKNVLERLRNYEMLSFEEAREIMLAIAGGLVNEIQITAFMAVYMMRRATIEELSGFRQALMELCVPIQPEAATEAIDIVGTGGDGKNTFNISTLSAAVVAGAGYKVMKHGNYAASSVTGSSDVLEYLGYHFQSDESNLNRQMAAANLCFLHAPLFHPAMKRVATIRQNLAVRTFFNLLGPLSNPARPRYMLLGVNSLAIARLYHYYLQEKGEDYTVIYSMDGYDEVSLTDKTKILGTYTDAIIDPSDFDFPYVEPEAISGGKDTVSAAEIFLSVLENRCTEAQKHVVLANSAIAIQTVNNHLSLPECVAEARHSLHSGNALNSFKTAINISRL